MEIDPFDPHLLSAYVDIARRYPGLKLADFRTRHVQEQVAAQAPRRATELYEYPAESSDGVERFFSSRAPK